MARQSDRRQGAIARVVAVHELELKPDADRAGFERVVRREIADLGRHMPGLVERRFLIGYKAERKGEYAMLWVFESAAALEALFGTEADPRQGPKAFVRYEAAIGPYLAAPRPDLIRYTDYLEIDGYP
jgi:hypothetical protein